MLGGLEKWDSVHENQPGAGENGNEEMVPGLNQGQRLMGAEINVHIFPEQEKMALPQRKRRKAM